MTNVFERLRLCDVRGVLEAFGRNQTRSVGHWYLFFRSKGSRPAHFRKDTNAPLATSPQDAEKLQVETLTLGRRQGGKEGVFTPLDEKENGFLIFCIFDFLLEILHVFDRLFVDLLNHIP